MHRRWLHNWQCTDEAGWQVNLLSGTNPAMLKESNALLVICQVYLVRESPAEGWVRKKFWL
jgi:hypothetical protein